MRNVIVKGTEIQNVTNVLTLEQLLVKTIIFAKNTNPSNEGTDKFLETDLKI